MADLQVDVGIGRVFCLGGAVEGQRRLNIPGFLQAMRALNADAPILRMQGEVAGIGLGGGGEGAAIAQPVGLGAKGGGVHGGQSSRRRRPVRYARGP